MNRRRVLWVFCGGVFLAGCGGSGGPSHGSGTRPAAQGPTLITGSDVSCDQFVSGKASSLTAGTYANGSVMPSGFDYWYRVSPSTNPAEFVLNQSVTGSAATPLLGTGSNVFSIVHGSCSPLSSTVNQNPNSPSTIRVAFTRAAGVSDYCILVDLDPAALGASGHGQSGTITDSISVAGVAGTARSIEFVGH